MIPYSRGILGSSGYLDLLKLACVSGRATGGTLTPIRKWPGTLSVH